MTNSNALPAGFVDLQAVIPGIAAELAYLGADNFVGRPIEGYQKKRVILTNEAAQALAKAQEELLKQELSLLIYDAYRPTRAVKDFIAWGNDLNDTKTKNTYYPDIEKHEIFDQGYICLRSSHSRGSAVDATIIPFSTSPDACSRPLDMGSPFDFFGRQSHIDYLEISPQQRANRLLLQTIMKKHNFMPLKEEWWHFTLVNEPFPDAYFDFPIK